MTSNVICGYSGASWEENSRGENACQVYADLQGLCNSSFVINSVVSTSPAYQPPNNACGCNVAAYNLQAACGWCQSSILTNWWLTESSWSNMCTAASYDRHGIPSSVTNLPGYSSIDFPAWAFATPTGATWLPSYAQSYSPSSSSAKARNLVGIVVGVILGIYALLAITVIVVYFMRQKKRKAWYGPMGQYYAGLKNGGGGNQPFMYSPNNAATYSPPPPMTTSTTPLSSGAYTYQPPPPATPAPAYNAGYATGPGNTNSMYGPPQPPQAGAAAAAGQGGYKGLAEVY